MLKSITTTGIYELGVWLEKKLNNWPEEAETIFDRINNYFTDEAMVGF